MIDHKVQILFRLWSDPHHALMDKLWGFLNFHELFFLRLNHLYLSNHQFILTILGCPKPTVKHYPQGLTLIPAWRSNRMSSNLTPSLGWNCLSIPKLQRYTVSNFHSTLYDGCNYLSTFWLKLNYISKKGPQGKIGITRIMSIGSRITWGRSPTIINQAILITNGRNSLKLIYKQMVVNWWYAFGFWSKYIVS